MRQAGTVDISAAAFAALCETCRRMARTEPTLTIGIEEEYLLVDRASRDLVHAAPKTLMAQCEAELRQQVSPEFLQCQIEIGTRVCSTIADARADLTRLRATIAKHAAEHGLAPIAASTHPFASWQDQHHTDKERYTVLAKDLQMPVRRMLICGMHVHVCVEDEDLRIDLFNQLPYFLPHLLALSTSSPFWEGKDTGLMSYRLSVFDELPRTGLPERFDSFGEYMRHVRVLVDAGVIEDASKIWWDVRPSARFPTLEMRASDMCTRLEDTLCIAALYVSLIAMLIRLRRRNQRWRIYANMLVRENRWRAQRYGFSEGLVDFGRGEVVPYAALLDEVIELVARDAGELGCRAEVAHARNILARGTSAHGQRMAYEQARLGGADTTEALRAVVDWLIAETKVGVVG
jgi:carboxylate-amine ligase